MSLINCLVKLTMLQIAKPVIVFIEDSDKDLAKISKQHSVGYLSFRKRQSYCNKRTQYCEEVCFRNFIDFVQVFKGLRSETGRKAKVFIVSKKAG